jgi:8-hydroxy-5-deazaflavin:NADPH oxidoreductase
MNIAVLGSGIVGRALSGKLAELGHSVVLGTRDVGDLLARTEPGMGGRLPPFSQWNEQNPAVGLGTFAEAAAHGEMVFNATAGSATLEVLRSAGNENLEGKILVDVSNPLDFSHGMPPTLLVCNTESLAEQIQQAFPGVNVVKTLNTMNASVMVDPKAVSGGDHHLFISGDDAEAKARVVELLKNDFGWMNIIDLGDITTARGPEMMLPLWVQLMGMLGTPAFNFKIAR